MSSNKPTETGKNIIKLKKPNLQFPKPPSSLNGWEVKSEIRTQEISSISLLNNVDSMNNFCND